MRDCGWSVLLVWDGRRGATDYSLADFLRKCREAIAQMQVQLDQWRSAQKGRTKLPESFWLAAVDLTKQYGVFPTAHTLRLDYTRLKKRLGGAVGDGEAEQSSRMSQPVSADERTMFM